MIDLFGLIFILLCVGAQLPSSSEYPPKPPQGENGPKEK